MKFSKLSTKGKIFYGSWIFINIIFVLQFINQSSKPVDRLRSVCNWDGVACAPSSDELAGQAIGNLIFWNLVFLAFRFFYNNRKVKKQTSAEE
jgi:hypothetical protein